MDTEDLEHLQSISAAHKRRLRILQEQKAKQGDNCPPEIISEIENIKKEMHALEIILEGQGDRELVLQEDDDRFVLRKLLRSDVFLDPRIPEQIRRLIDDAQNIARLLSYIDMCEELINHLEGSHDEKYISIYMPFIRNKVNYIISMTKFDRCYFILARLYHMIQDYRNCVNILEELVKFEPKNKNYRHYIARAYYDYANLQYNDANDVNLDTSISKRLLEEAIEKIKSAEENLGIAEYEGFRIIDTESLRSKIANIYENIQEDLLVIKQKETDKQREQDRIIEELEETKIKLRELQERRRQEQAQIQNENREYDTQDKGTL